MPSVWRPIFGVHDQDKDDVGFANEGEVPFFAATDFQFIFRRLLLMP